MVLGAVGPFAYFGRAGPYKGDLLATLRTVVADISHLTLHVEVKGQSKSDVRRAVEKASWNRLDGCLAENLKRLQSFTVSLSGMFWYRAEDSPPEGSAANYIYGEMPMAARKGILRLDGVDI